MRLCGVKGRVLLPALEPLLLNLLRVVALVARARNVWFLRHGELVGSEM
jgi:hypothetical protein